MRSAATARVVAAALVLLPSTLLAQSSACNVVPPGVSRVESQRYIVVFRAVPIKPPVSTHFTLDVTVCPKADAPLAQDIAVDARMPAHGHGMNYKPTIKRVGDAMFRAEGLMFHMPGRWQLIFDVSAGSVTERLTHDIVL